MQRRDGRQHDAMRPMKVAYDVYAYASGSTLFEVGGTKILTAVTLQHNVPHFLRGKRTGWLTAEYAMLPAATPVRTVREVVSHKRSGRTVEISRLIGRALRSVVRLDLLGERTIFIDCDVMQADGSTRTACVNGAYLALRAAEQRWLAEGIILEPIIREELAAVAVGVSHEGLLLDIDYLEDVSICADFTVVMTRSGGIIEIQGTAEASPVAWEQYMHIQELAQRGAAQVMECFDAYPYHVNEQSVAYKMGSTVRHQRYELGE